MSYDFMFTKENQTKLKQEYAALLPDVWGKDKKMIDFCLKKADLLFKTSEGFIVEIEKPSIKKHFCFGYRLGDDGTEYREANAAASAARKDVDYFLEENLQDLKRRIENLSKENEDYYFQNHYWKQTNNVMKSLVSFHYWEVPADISKGEYKEYTPVNKEARALILAAYKEELKRFTKRLETYLKRYGLSCVHTWSYWQDA